MSDVNKPFLIFSILLFTAIITGAIVIEKIIEAGEAELVPKTLIKTRSPGP